MGSVRPWQIVLFAAALIALGTGLFLSLKNPNKVKFKDEVHLVDVVTGETFVYGTSKGGVVLPAIHPDTGDRTLLRAIVSEDGVWYIEARSLDRLGEFETVSDRINLDSGAVDPLNEKPRRIRKSDFLKHLGGA